MGITIAVEKRSNAKAADLHRCGCQECSDVRRLAITLAPRASSVRGDEAHASGSVIHWDERDPENPHWRMIVTCFQCGHDRFVPKPTIRSGHWSGRCQDCIERYALPQKRRTLTGKYTNPFGAVIDFEAPHEENKALVYCPNFATCGGTSQKNISRNNQDAQPFYCRACGTKDKHSRLASAWEAAKAPKPTNGGGQRNGGTERKRPGPEKGYNAKITEKTIREAFRILGRYAPQEKLAEKLGVDARSLRDWHKAHGLTYKQLGQQFTEPEVVS